MTFKRPSDQLPARWIVQVIHDFAQDVGSVVPSGFESYCRIFHPAALTLTEGVHTPVAWTEIAASNAKVAHGTMEFPAIVPDQCFEGLEHTAGQPGLWDWAPEEGTLPADLADALVSVLQRYSNTTERCWFAYWDGWGIPVTLTEADEAPDPTVAAAQRRFVGEMEAKLKGPMFSLPNRTYMLFENGLEGALKSWYEPPFDWWYQSASLWWPDDRAWCVATEIDFSSTYVGGDEECIWAVLNHPRIEALPVSITDPIARDLINVRS